MISDEALERQLNFALTLYHCWKCGLHGDDFEEFKKLKAEFMGQAADTAFFKCPVCGNMEGVLNLNILDKIRKEEKEKKESK